MFGKLTLINNMWQLIIVTSIGGVYIYLYNHPLFFSFLNFSFFFFLQIQFMGARDKHFGQKPHFII